MNRTIYHGSDHIIRAPGFGAGRAYNDFGLGFYCSETAAHAAAWAVGRSANGFISAYNINTDGLRIINLCSSRYNALHWLGILLSFRRFDSAGPLVHQAGEYINKYYPLDYQGCDCIIGYRADNSCFLFAQQFLNGSISYQSLSRALSERSSNRQYVLKSNRAFERISYAGYVTAASDEYYAGIVSSELRAIEAMRPAQGKTDLFIDQMIKEEIRPYDPRLQ